jgi:putative MATE family efflux protein
MSVASTLREAVRGTQQDLTAIPIRRAVVLLAVPTLLEMSMESILVVVDMFFVSRLGSAAVATVGITEVMLSPTYALAMGLASAATAVIARRAGEKEWDGAAIAAVQVMLLAVALAVPLGGSGSALSAALLALMGADGDVVATGSAYTAVMLAGSVTIFLLFVGSAIFRSVGEAAVAMRALWLANTVNIVLAPCFIFGVGPIPRMGVVGAAVATTVGRGLGIAYQLSVLARRRGHLAIARRHIALQLHLAAELVRLAMPATGQVLIETASWLALVRILASYGSAALAGYTIAMRIVIFALLPSWGLAQAAAALVGQNLGAKAPERARLTVWTIARYNATVLAPLGAFLVIAPGWVVAVFTRDPAVAVYATDCLRIVAVGLVAFAFGMVAVQAYNGAGDTTTPMLVNVASFWLFKLPCALVLSKVAGFGPRGVFIAITAGYAMQSLVAVTLFRRNRWERRHV